ncbi:bile acid:sodium symporter family protein [Curvibacter sp. APW13]|uniref:bile acid:sodium symporter family protein n=1 Tax=Curvibacter sp. APW13 TaxID=3077236 RepID=UPI0028DDE6B1|nr:bile acid:sodium symporter family protein [Curvibacter sp. APW13]MDT8989447.1 bile acid:sodium symporter family protein [Curvibacter sp. APW13]
MLPIDQVQLQFNPATLAGLNAILGLVMFGIALDLRVSDFREAFRSPKGLLLATIGHHILFPAMTYVLIWIMQPSPSIALGMILVSSCPAGHLSNFLTHLSKGNAALSVSASAISTALAIVMTPLNFNFWGNLHPITHDLMQTISIDPWVMLKDIIILLGIPLVAGMGVAHKFPAFAKRAEKPMKRFSMVVFALFVVGALAANFQHFLQYIQFVVLLVFIHNGLALVTGYGLSTLLRLPERDRRAVTFEMGIQNSGLGLILIFNMFHGLGGMAIITAWWGIWHIVSGLSLALFWSKRDPQPGIRGY